MLRRQKHALSESTTPSACTLNSLERCLQNGDFGRWRFCSMGSGFRRRPGLWHECKSALRTKTMGDARMQGRFGIATAGYTFLTRNMLKTS